MVSARFHVFPERRAQFKLRGFGRCLEFVVFCAVAELLALRRSIQRTERPQQANGHVERSLQRRRLKAVTFVCYRIDVTFSGKLLS